MNLDDKLRLLDLFRLALDRRDADTASEVIERFAAEGNPIAEQLAHQFNDAGLGGV
jgi:hypothetical protein